MVDARVPYGARGYSGTPAGSDDGWGPATPVRSAASQRADTQRTEGRDTRRDTPRRDTRRDAPHHTRRLDEPSPRPAAPPTRAATPRQAPARFAHADSARPDTAYRGARAVPGDDSGRGLPSWAGVVVLLVIAGIGGVIDAASGTQSRGAFNIAIIVASIVAILAVRRSGMFPVVVAPPIVYALASGGMLYVRSGGLHDHKVLFGAAANWLVYGFPAMAAATAAVLIIAGVRMIAHK